MPTVCLPTELSQKCPNGARSPERVESNNFGAAIGQSQQLVPSTGESRGAAPAKSLPGLKRQSGKCGALRVFFIGGAFTRATGSAPFALPPSWLAASGKVNKAQRFSFVSTKDITGCNSGSPGRNRNADVMGLAFDGDIHSIGGAFAFDERVNRTVAVQSGAIVEALDKFYGAGFLVDELLGRPAR